MKTKTPRKLNEPEPNLPGWTYTDLTNNMSIRCRDCGRIVKQFFYRWVYRIEPPIGMNEAVCLKCVPGLDANGYKARI